MAMHELRRCVAFLAMVTCLGRVGSGQDVLVAPSVETLKTRVNVWLQPRLAGRPELKESVDRLWQFGDHTPTPTERFDSLMRTFYLADEDVRELVEGCRPADRSILLREYRALTSHHDEPLFASNVRAFYARFLATATLYEEALAIYREIDVKQIVDPATVLFYKAVCEHVLLERDAGLDTLHRLLDETANVPTRYRAVAELMKGDLEELEEKSLGEVARQMADVHRRLELGRAGEKVQRVEDRIIATLDEIIKQKEDQQNSSSSGGGSSNRQMQPNEPKGAEDTYLGGIKGQGLTERKDIGHKDNWGQLPEKSQADAKAMLEKQFPGHYRQAVEEYLKKLAQREAPSKP